MNNNLDELYNIYFNPRFTIFKNTIIAILKSCPGLKSLQLRKALVIIDGLHYALYGKRITQTIYIKHIQGVVPNVDAFFDICEMYYLGIITKEKNDDEEYLYYTKQFKKPKKIKKIVFTENQLDIINWTAKTIKKYPEKELWKIAPLQDYMYNKTLIGEEIFLDLICQFAITGLNTKPFSNLEKKEMINILLTDKYPFSTLYKIKKKEVVDNFPFITKNIEELETEIHKSPTIAKKDILIIDNKKISIYKNSLKTNIFKGVFPEAYICFTILYTITKYNEIVFLNISILKNN